MTKHEAQTARHMAGRSAVRDADAREVARHLHGPQCDLPLNVRELADEIRKKGDTGVSNQQRNLAAADSRTFERWDVRYVLRDGYILDAKTGTKLDAEAQGEVKKSKKKQWAA